MPKIAVSLSNISKKYTLYHEKPTLLRSVFARRKPDTFFALKNINMSLEKGSKVGIVGPNGAGKTTLLKIIAGITTPTSGKVITNGRIISLMNLEAGFHPDLTGEENIYLNGMIIGMTTSEIEKKFKRIISFAEIGKFIDAPFYTYSDGMKFRLAFSLAIVTRCDILIMDEVFVSGDIDFQNRALTEIKKVQKRSSMTTIVCSHIPTMVWTLSENYYYLEEGQLSKLLEKGMYKLVKERERQWRQGIHPS